MIKLSQPSIKNRKASQVDICNVIEALLKDLGFTIYTNTEFTKVKTIPDKYSIRNAHYVSIYNQRA